MSKRWFLRKFYQKVSVISMAFFLLISVLMPFFIVKGDSVSTKKRTFPLEPGIKISISMIFENEILFQHSNQPNCLKLEINPVEIGDFQFQLVQVLLRIKEVSTGQELWKVFRLWGEPTKLGNSSIIEDFSFIIKPGELGLNFLQSTVVNIQTELTLKLIRFGKNIQRLHTPALPELNIDLRNDYRYIDWKGFLLLFITLIPALMTLPNFKKASRKSLRDGLWATGFSKTLVTLIAVVDNQNILTFLSILVLILIFPLSNGYKAKETKRNIIIFISAMVLIASSYILASRGTGKL